MQFLRAGEELAVVIAHRGASAHEPENTLRSFRRALELGATAIEFDVRKTRDGHLVVMHDETVDRTTNGKGRVSVMALSELRSLDAGLGERVPTFEEAIEMIGGKALLVVEIKVRGLWADVVQTLRKEGSLGQALIISFLAEEIAELKRAVPEVKAGVLFRGAPREAIGRASAAKADVAGFRHDALSSEIVRDAHTAGLRLLTWTVDNPEIARAVASRGVSYIAANAPDRILPAVGK